MADNEVPKDIAETAPTGDSAPVAETPVTKAVAVETPAVEAAAAKAKIKPAKSKPVVVPPVEIAAAPAALAPAPEAPKLVPEAAVAPVEAAPVEPAPATVVVAAPAKVKPAPKFKAAVKAKPAIKIAAPKISAPKVKPAPKAVVKAGPAIMPTVPVKAKPGPAARVFPVKPVVAKPAIKVAQEVEKTATVAASPKAAAFKTAQKTVANQATAFAGLFTNFMLEDNKMDMTANFSGLQDAMTEAQAKAKAAFEKGTSVLGEVSDFTKGNVEAVMESGKILAEGVQGLGSELVSEGRTAFEAMTGDIKELAAAKSPTDFFKLQGDMMRKNFDSAVAYGSKNSEAMLELMSDVMAPISGRVSMAMEKARSASL